MIVERSRPDPIGFFTQGKSEPRIATFCPGFWEMWTEKMPRAALDCREAESETELC